MNRSQEKAIRNSKAVAKLSRVENNVRVRIEEFVEELTGGFVKYQRQATDAKGNVAYASVKLGPRGKVWSEEFNVVQA